MDNEESVALVLQIMDHEYRVACHPSEQEDLAAAADSLNERLREIRNTGKLLGMERIAVMAALNASYELLKRNRRLQELDDNIDSRLRNLLNKVDGAIRKSAV